MPAAKVAPAAVASGGRGDKTAGVVSTAESIAKAPPPLPSSNNGQQEPTAASSAKETPSTPRMRRHGMAISNDRPLPTFAVPESRTITPPNAATEPRKSEPLPQTRPVSMNDRQPEQQQQPQANQPQGQGQQEQKPVQERQQIVLDGGVPATPGERPSIARPIDAWPSQRASNTLHDDSQKAFEAQHKQSLPGQVSSASLHLAPKSRSRVRVPSAKGHLLPPSRGSHAPGEAGARAESVHSRPSRGGESIVSDFSHQLTVVPENTACSSSSFRHDEEESHELENERRLEDGEAKRLAAGGKPPFVVPKLRVNSMPPSNDPAVNFPDMFPEESVMKASLYIEDALEGR